MKEEVKPFEFDKPEDKLEKIIITPEEFLNYELNKLGEKNGNNN